MADPPRTKSVADQFAEILIMTAIHWGYVLIECTSVGIKSYRWLIERGKKLLAQEQLFHATISVS